MRGASSLFREGWLDASFGEVQRGLFVAVLHAPEFLYIYVCVYVSKERVGKRVNEPLIK